MATVVSHIVVREAGKAADWYATALGADVGRRIQVPDGRFMQIELRFGDSQVMIADEFPEMGAVSPLTLGGTVRRSHDRNRRRRRAVATRP